MTWASGSKLGKEPWHRRTTDRSLGMLGRSSRLQKTTPIPPRLLRPGTALNHRVPFGHLGRALAGGSADRLPFGSVWCFLGMRVRFSLLAAGLQDWGHLHGARWAADLTVAASLPDPAPSPAAPTSPHRTPGTPLAALPLGTARGQARG